MIKGIGRMWRKKKQPESSRAQTFLGDYLKRRRANVGTGEACVIGQPVSGYALEIPAWAVKMQQHCCNLVIA